MSGVNGMNFHSSGMILNVSEWGEHQFHNVISCITEWKLLPELVVRAPSINCFKNHLDKITGNAKYHTTYPDQNWVLDHEGVIEDI